MKKEKKRNCVVYIRYKSTRVSATGISPPYSSCGKPHLTNLPTRVKFSSEDLQEKIHFLQWSNTMLQQYLMSQQMRANRTQSRNDPGLRFGPWSTLDSSFLKTWQYHPKMRQYILLIASALCWKWKIQRAAGTWTRCTGHWILAHVNVVHCEGEPGELRASTWDRSLDGHGGDLK